MVSICVFKKCPHQKGSLKFHRLLKVMKQLRIPLKALGPFNINIVSKNSWICSYHLQVLNPYVGNEENMRPFPYSFAFENENVRPSLLMNVLETDVRNVLSPLPEDLNNGHDVHRSFSNPRPSRFLDTVLELVEGNYAIIGKVKNWWKSFRNFYFF